MKKKNKRGQGKSSWQDSLGKEHVVSREGLFAVLIFSFLRPLYIRQLLSEWADRLCHPAMMLNIRVYSAQRRLEIWDYHKILLRLDSEQTSEGKTENTIGGDAKS